jgi:hypothetical protein
LAELQDEIGDLIGLVLLLQSRMLPFTSSSPEQKIRRRGGQFMHID